MDGAVNVVVIVKSVHDQHHRALTPSRRRAADGDLAIGETDEYAIATASAIATTTSGTVTALSVGPENSASGLRRAAQLGADRVVLIADPRTAGADAVATAQVIAAAIRSIGGADVVVAAAASDDSATGAVPAVVAAELGLPALLRADAVQVSDGLVQVERRETSTVVSLAAPLPALVSVTDRTPPASYPTFARIAKARRIPVEVIDLDAIGLGSAPPQTRTVVTGVTARVRRTGGRVIVDDGTAAATLVAYLAEHDLLPATVRS